MQTSALLSTGSSPTVSSLHCLHTSTIKANKILDPVLLCNELGVATPTVDNGIDPNMITSCGRTDMSIKEAVRIAQSNNFMGLIVTSRLLELVPALVDSIKEAGLVLISDHSYDAKLPKPGVLDLAKGIDGLVAENAVMRFREAVD